MVDENTSSNMRIIKRCILGLYDITGAAAIAALLLLCAPQPAFAYVDPSVMTYTIQALAGVAVAVGAVASVAFRRTRKKLMALLNIDPDRNKISEPPVSAISAEGADVIAETLIQAGMSEANARTAANPVKVPVPMTGLMAKMPQKLQNVFKTRKSQETQNPQQSTSTSTPKPKRETFVVPTKRKIIEALLVALFFSFTLFVVAPLEIVAGGYDSLRFGITDIVGIILSFAALVAIVLFVLLFVLRGRGFLAGIAVVFTLTLCFYIQAMFLNADLPIANGSTVSWGSYMGTMIVTALAWVAAIVLVIFAVRKNQRLFHTLALALSAALVVVQCVGVISLFFPAPQANTVVISDEGLNTVSSKNNVIVFVLDTFDQSLLEELQQENPNVLDGFDGFTEYRNATGSMMPTRYGAPFLLTGVFPQTDESFETFLENRYYRSDFLSDISKAGYSIGVYSENASIPEDIVEEGFIMNMEPSNHKDVNGSELLAMLVQCSLYRDVPWILKPYYWYTTDQINNTAVGTAVTKDGYHEYTINDPKNFAYLQKVGIQASDMAEQGAFRYIHLLGPHGPYTMNAVGAETYSSTTIEDQALGSLYIVRWYLDQLKALGVYDQSTIIVTADHGEWWAFTEPVYEPTYPIYLVKQAGSVEATGAGDVRAGAASAGAACADNTREIDAYVAFEQAKIAAKKAEEAAAKAAEEAEEAAAAAAAAEEAGEEAAEAAAEEAAESEESAESEETEETELDPLTVKVNTVKVSLVPTGHLDYCATVIDAIGGDVSKYGTPSRLVPAGPRIRYYYDTVSTGKRDAAVYLWQIDGFVWNFNNWQLTGEVWNII